jgi:predicted outer membrane repeat protein
VRPWLRSAHPFALVFAVGTVLAAASPAAVIVVETVSDGAVGPLCPLRNAIASANADKAIGGCDAGSGPDVIDMRGLSGLPDTIDLVSPLPPIQADLEILGPGADRLAVNGGDAHGLFVVQPGVTLAVSDLAITRGLAADSGPGGGFEVGAGAMLTLVGCRVEGNRASEGGGVASSGGAVEVLGCTFSGNSASSGSGGAIALRGATLEATNSTLSGNDASTSGGAIAAWTDGGPSSADLHSVTLAENSAAQGGALFVDTGSTVTLTHALLTAGPSGGICAGAVTSAGHNLTDDMSCGFALATDLEVADAKISPLGDHGGPTPTHDLLAGSPAVDAGAAVCVGADGFVLTNDQRGEPRPTDGDGLPGFECDIGAVEALPEPGAATLALVALGTLAVLLARRAPKARARYHRSTAPREDSCTSRFSTRSRTRSPRSP